MNVAAPEALAHAARVALVGNPNSGKTALFNALTGSRQKVANYAGVTVERKEGQLKTAEGRTLSVLDLPGTYSLRARSPDEEVTRDAVLGRLAGEQPPDVDVETGLLPHFARGGGGGILAWLDAAARQRP